MADLDPNEILSREFEYAAQTAFQANEDRVGLVNYYLGALGTLIAVLALLDLHNPLHLGAFGLLTCGLAVLGVMSLLKLAKLRLAWRDSVLAMCQIKEHYISRAAGMDLSSAFRWRMSTVPAAGKKWSMAFLMAVTTAVLSSVSVGATVLLWGLALQVRLGLWAGLSALVALITQILLWIRLCRER